MISGTIITLIAIGLLTMTLNDKYNHNYINMSITSGLLGMAGLVFYLGGFLYG